MPLYAYLSNEDHTVRLEDERGELIAVLTTTEARTLATSVLTCAEDARLRETERTRHRGLHRPTRRTGNAKRVHRAGRGRLGRFGAVVMAVNLFDFECLQSDDLVKADLELTCLKCAAVLCDVEGQDSLGVLTSVAVSHVCPRAEAL